MATNSEPLFSKEAEDALVGAILIDPGLLNLIDLPAEAFYIRRLGTIWSACKRLSAANQGIDVLTVCDELDRLNKLEEAGGMPFLIELINATPSAYGAEDYARIVSDYAGRRQWRELANRMAKTAFDLDQDLEQAAPAIVDQLLRAVEAPGAATHIRSFAWDVYREAAERKANPKDSWGIPTGFTEFDQITGGLQPGETLLISGEPGKGKSILAMQMAFQMAEQGYPGVIYSLEMGGVQVVRRRISHLARVLMTDMKSGHIDDTQLCDLKQAVERIEQLPLYMSDASGWTTASLRADLTRMCVQAGVRWFVLDYAYLLQDGRSMSENDRTGLISAQLKGICRSLNLAGVVITSLRKAGMNAGNNGAHGSDIRGSGQQFYDADLLLMLADRIAENGRPDPSVLVCTFGKGRELEKPSQYFYLTRLPGFPALGNYAPDSREPGRYSGR